LKELSKNNTQSTNNEIVKEKPCFTYKPTTGCVMGKNMKKLKDVTFEQCKLACDKKKKCMGVEYFKKSGASRISSAY